MTAVLIGVLVWLALAARAAVAIGRAIHYRDQRETPRQRTPDDARGLR